MDEEISISFTKDEWRAVSVLIRQHIKEIKLGDVDERKQKLKAMIVSNERELNQLNREEVGTKHFLSIIDKIDKHLR